MKNGTKILHYRIIEPLDKGGMGEIYKAEDTKLKRYVALKFLSSSLINDSEERERFLQEARIAALIDHQNICTVYSIEEIQDFMLISMSYIKGRNLSEIIRSDSLKIPNIIKIAIQIGHGLKAAHEKGIIHLDLKSTNIMINTKDEVKITDFGISKLLEMKQTHFAGTPAYISPEQALGQSVDQRSDIFSFGIILYEMIIGQLPFKGESYQEIIYSIVSEPYTPIEITSSIQEPLLAIIDKALAKKADDRYQNIDELITDLENITSPTSDVKLKENKHKLFNTLSAVGFLFLLCLILYFGIFSQNKYAFTKGDWIAIGEFQNATSDSMYDNILKEGLRIGIQQSTFLSVLPRNKITSYLKLMGKPLNTILTEDVIKEICIRAGVKAYIVGQINQVGQGYLITARVVHANEGVDIRVAQSKAINKEDILLSIDDISYQLRQGLGESLASIQQNTRPLQEVCTRSLDALRYFSIGADYHEAGLLDKALPFYLQAIANDSTFALAYSILGFLYQNIGNTTDWVVATDKAYQLCKHSTEREQLLIEAFYHLAHQRFSKSIPLFELILKMHTNDLSARHNLAWAYRKLDNFEKSIEEDSILLKIDPLPWLITYSNLTTTLLLANHNDHVPIYLNKMNKINPLSVFYLNNKCLYEITVDQLNNAEQTAQKLYTINEPAKSVGITKLATLKIVQGKIDTAIDHLIIGLNIDEKHNLTRPMYEKYCLLYPLFEFINDSASIKQCLQNLEKTDNYNSAIELAAEINYKFFDYTKAEILTKKFQKYAAETNEQKDEARVLRLKAIAALYSNKLEQAIMLAEQALDIHDSPSIRILLGRLYTKAEKHQEAQFQYKIFIKNKAWAFYENRCVDWIIAHNELAKIYELLNDNQNYQYWHTKYKKMWKNV